MASAYDLRAWDTFDATSQKTLLAGGTVTGGDGRKFVLLNGHATTVGSATYNTLMAQRTANAAPTATTPTAAPGVTAPTFSPAPPKGAWMNPPEFFGGRTTYPDGSSVPGNQTGTGTGSGAQVPDPDQAAKDAANRDALARIKDVLGQYGLESLADFAWREIVSGRSETEVLQDLRETQQFKDRFPAIADRKAKGLPALSPAEYIAYEQSATQMMRAAGIPSGFYDSPQDFTKFLSNDVSVKELSDRVDLARQAAYQAPTEVRMALRTQFGLGDGDLAAFFLDPERATPLLQRTYNAATIAGASARTGFSTNAQQDYMLADLGVSADQAQAGFNALGQQKGLFDPLLGHNEGQITVDEQLGAAFGGSVAASQKIEQRRQNRVAEFGGGGGFAATQGGLSGIGSSQQ